MHVDNSLVIYADTGGVAEGFEPWIEPDEVLKERSGIVLPTPIRHHLVGGPGGVTDVVRHLEFQLIAGSLSMLLRLPLRHGCVQNRKNLIINTHNHYHKHQHALS